MADRFADQLAIALGKARGPIARLAVSQGPRDARIADGHLMGWSARFFDPINLPSGRKLLTLRDAATYITELPKAEHDAPEWQAAMETLLLVAERDGPEMMARIAMLRALNLY